MQDEVEQQIIEQSEKTKRADLHVAKLRKQLATAPGQRSEIELDMQVPKDHQRVYLIIKHFLTLWMTRDLRTMQQTLVARWLLLPYPSHCFLFLHTFITCPV